jgi:ketosteroid isomerase-like protein
MSRKPKATDEAEVRALVESWAQAVRDMDMDKIIAHHTEDILMFDVPLPLSLWKAINCGGLRRALCLRKSDPSDL